MAEDTSKSLAYNLGAFFGHIARAVRTDVTSQPASPGAASNASILVRAEVNEARVETSQGPLTLRRTVIDEVCPNVDEGASGAAAR